MNDNKELEVLEIGIGNIHCMTCVGKIENYFKQLDGMDVVVNFVMESATFTFNPDMWDLSSISESLRMLGYKARPTGKYKKTFSDWELLIELYLAILISGFLMIPHLSYGFTTLLTDWGVMSNPFTFGGWGEFVMGHGGHNPNMTFIFIITFIVQFVIGRRFYKSAWIGIKNKILGMDLLISIGTTTAFVYSFLVWQGFLQGTTYFEVSAEVITFLMVGKVIEKKVNNRSKESLLEKASMKAEFANVLVKGKLERKKITDVRIGEIVLVKKGERIPIDGELVEGEAYIDESMITGEAHHIKKQKGDSVIGSTINLSDIIKVKVTTTDADSVISKIINTISKLASEKPPIQKIADKISNIFIPTVIGAAIITFITWNITNGNSDKAIEASLAVVVVACPCTLGLATPLAMLIGSTRASDAGIIFNRSDVLEKVKTIDTVCFDKTGTLTEGKLNIKLIEGDDSVVNEIVSIEALSSHPISNAFMSYKHDHDIEALEVKGMKEIAGKGLEAKINKDTYTIGSFKFINTVDKIPKKFVDIAKKEQALNNVVVYAMKNKKFKTMFVLEDKLKNTAKESIDKLKAHGIKVVMITGDNKITANNVAKEVGIENVFAEVTPEMKSDIVKDLQRDGSKVAFIGDGINDSIALKQSDLAIAMGDGSDIAIASSDITILNNDVDQVLNAIVISKRTLFKIKQNLSFAFVYNAFGITIAATGFIGPVFSAIFMTTESLIVVGNTLRLKRIKFL